LGYWSLFLGLRVNQLVMERLRAAGFQNVRESHGYVIQHLIEKGRSITELAQRMKVTQQAASKVVAELARLGVVELAQGTDHRAKSATLSPYGWTMVRRGRRYRCVIERRFIRRVGSQEYEAAKATLAACLDLLGGVDMVRLRRIPPPQ